MDITEATVWSLAYIHGKDEVTGSNPVRGSIFYLDVLISDLRLPDG